MRDPLLPVLLLCTGAGLTLGSGKARLVRYAPVVVIGAAIAFLGLRDAGPSMESVFAVAWIVVIVAATAALAGERASSMLALPIAAAAGCVIGLLVADWRILIAATTLALAFLAAKFLAAHGPALAVKVAAGWLLAIAALNLTLTMLPVTPGYLPDHLE